MFHGVWSSSCHRCGQDVSATEYCGIEHIFLIDDDADNDDDEGDEGED